MDTGESLTNLGFFGNIISQDTKIDEKTPSVGDVAGQMRFAWKRIWPATETCYQPSSVSPDTQGFDLLFRNPGIFRFVINELFI